MSKHTVKRTTRRRRPAKLRSLAALAALGEPATVGRIYLGHNLNLGPNGAKTGELDRRFIERAARTIAMNTNGAVTVQSADGIYTGVGSDGKKWETEEKSTVFTSIVPEFDRSSCRRAVRRLHEAARHLARKGLQNSVLVEVRCADGREDAALVKRTGQTNSLDPLRFKTAKRSR